MILTTCNVNQSCHVKLCFVSADASYIYKNAGGIGYATTLSAGLDLRACFAAAEISIGIGERLSIPTGIIIAPSMNNIAGFLYSRSGLGAIQGLTVAQGVGIIDPDYRGEIKVVLLNTSGQIQIISRGMRIAQLVFQPFYKAEIEEVDALDITERGDGGFGHTGLK